MQQIRVEGQSVTPSKIVCIGRNYVDHINELGNEMPTEPVIFIKPNSAITDTITFDLQEDIHYEAELTFVVQGGALSGVGIGLDLTKRAVQSQLKAKGLPWERAKAFDGSAVLSDFVTIPGRIEELSLELYINGELTQLATFDLMLHKPNDILAQVSTFMTCAEGDLIMTGTPKGVGSIRLGATFMARVLSNQHTILEHTWKVK
ncbi:MAG: fumarylacetoacetate hydrolase family protein [Glaciecola sp.]|jgi:2-keto-4-pentenoate hydratase/2-oxohepta-3-ene-1,7-dioic acid hydratase in catechol pathway|nr:fumarylacetoacetate hydrolase family protein [Glaciecola sp.]MDG2099019.1 fumarylacetoacetate hydrolase family protein [Glaciecola sp.]